MVDSLAHGLWSYIIFRKLKPKKNIKLAILFGVLPDLGSWTIYLFYRLFTNGFKMGPPDLGRIPDWAFTLYGISHSLVIFSLVALIIYVIFKKIPTYLYAWPVHILIDIPTHSRSFLPTPFLWPVSDFKFPGIGWGSPFVFFTNYFLIILFLVYILVFEKRKSKM